PRFVALLPAVTEDKVARPDKAATGFGEVGPDSVERLVLGECAGKHEVIGILVPTPADGGMRDAVLETKLLVSGFGRRVHVASVLVHDTHTLRGDLLYQLLGLILQPLEVVARHDQDAIDGMSGTPDDPSGGMPALRLRAGVTDIARALGQAQLEGDIGELIDIGVACQLAEPRGT